jgi:hypothetical protein
MARRTANGLLHVLGQEVGIPRLGLDKTGCCALAFDEVVVNFELDEEAHQLFLYASLGSVPEEVPAAFYRELLDGNLFWKDTGGATLGLDREGQRVILHQTVAVGRISDTDFKALVERFVNVAEAWSRRLEEALARPAASATPPLLIHPDMLV